MKFNAGDKAFFKNYALRYTPCVVLKVLEKSTRYRIQYISEWNKDSKTENKIVNESELFLNPIEGINSEIKQKQILIGRIQAEIIELNNRKTKITEVKEQGVVITETPKPALSACDPEDSKPEHKE